MPSGARKRKAAKKKKEKETNTNPTTNNPQGNNELKSQDEKGSEGGYHDHDDNPFIEGIEEVEEECDPSGLQPSVADANPIGGKQDGDGDVMVEQGLESGESCESKNVSVVQLESVKGSDYGNGNSVGLNDETVAENSKDEPYNSVKETVAFDDLDEIVAENSKDEPYNSVKEMVAFDDLVKSIDSSHAKMTLIAENAPVGETGNSLVESPAVASKSEVKSSDTGNALPEKSVASQVGPPIDLAMKKNEDKVYPSSDGAEHVKDSETPECSENQPLITSAPRVVQKTSWLNCCGLFEVLTGSNR